MITLHHGECLTVMRGMADASVDSIVTDPPYHLTSIVKRFGGENAAPVKVNEFFDEGGKSKGSSPYKRVSSGFMGKQWDGGDIAFRIELWAEVCRVLKPGGYVVAFGSSRGHHRMFCAIEDAGLIIHPMLGWITGQGFPKAHKVEAEGWEGWRYGLQSLKPAIEPICLAQKPMSEKTGTANVLKHGTGAINIAACRVESVGGRAREGEASQGRRYTNNGSTNFAATPGPRGGDEAGRWPAQICHDGSDEVLEAFARFGEKASGGVSHQPKRTHLRGNVSNGTNVRRDPDSGTAARFFFCGKATREERGDGNNHPCVKPLALLSWLCRLITPPEGVILDPFLGSGSTAIAADREGFSCIGIEREAEYLEIARRRIHGDAPLLTELTACA